MSGIHEISSTDFFETTPPPPFFRQLLLSAMETKRAVEARVHAGYVRLALVDAPIPAGIVLSGTWRSNDFAAAKLDNVGVKLTLPFLFQTNAITIPAEHIYTYGARHRAVSDFFIRNFFLAACRNTPVTCVSQPGDADSEDAMRTLRRQYYYLIKSRFEEPELAARPTDEAIDFLVANAYLGVLDLNDPLLRMAGQKLRAMHSGGGAANPVPQMLSQLKAVQADMQVHL